MAAYYVNRPAGEDDGRRRAPIPNREAAVACVPFVPWACPSCGNTKPRTYGREGRVRYHECECGLYYRSMELNSDELKDPEALKKLL